MAHNNTEVEIKVRVTKNRFGKIRKELRKNCKFIKTVHHIDTYYDRLGKSFLKPKFPYEWLSIRERGKDILLNYKHWYPESIKNTTHCDEYEIKLDDKNQLEKIFKAIEINKIVTVNKKRQTYVYKNEIEIALDKVKGLGYFIEVESLKNKGGIKSAYKKLEDFLYFLGIKKIKIIPGGYAAEMMRQKGLMKKF